MAFADDILIKAHTEDEVKVIIKNLERLQESHKLELNKSKS
jgi:hypothetical protein